VDKLAAPFPAPPGGQIRAGRSWAHVRLDSRYFAGYPRGGLAYFTAPAALHRSG
jgi:hypothetical protein